MANSDRKFRELILFVAQESENDENCGATKLNKILFYADFEAYRKLGQPISGQKYQKLERGPAPKGAVPVISEMEKAGLCKWEDREYFGLPLKKLIPRRDSDLSVFAPEELDIARAVINELWDLNAAEVSDLSHDFVGWQAASLGEEIPYETAFVGKPRPLTPDELAWAHEVIQDYLDERKTA
ncbi:MAG TPA: Panacea domain-containing protein [Thermoanaerobaculia bacterium]|nr:Panacea domain-containing protein [Thermoanaerobaculia bacterium]